jgi:hypothetical protein
MRDVWLLVIGSALALAGSVVADSLRARREGRQWRRERDERRLDRAALDLARLRYFVQNWSPNYLVTSFDPEDPYAEGRRRMQEWDELAIEVFRIGVVHPELAVDVDSLLEKMVEMIDLTKESIRRVAGNIADPPVDKASNARVEALNMLVALSRRLAGTS